jgi:hypothetical protein
MIDIFEMSNSLRRISDTIPNYMRYLREKLEILLPYTTSPGDGEVRTYPWREFHSFSVEKTIKTHAYETFDAYLEKWSKFTVDDLRKLFRDDADILNRLDIVMQRKIGVHINHDVDNVNITGRPTGNSKDATIRRLRKDHPELLEKVTSGEISANAGAILAGFRKPTVQLQVGSDVNAVADKIRHHFGDEFSNQLAQALLKGEWDAKPLI